MSPWCILRRRNPPPSPDATAMRGPHSMKNQAPRRQLRPPVVTADTAKPTPLHTDLTGKTVTFQFSVGSGSKPLEIKGSFTISEAPAEASKGR